MSEPYQYIIVSYAYHPIIYIYPYRKSFMWCKIYYPGCAEVWDSIFSFMFNKTIFECISLVIKTRWKCCCENATGNFCITERESLPSVPPGDPTNSTCSQCKNRHAPFLSGTYTQPYSVLREKYQVYLWLVRTTTLACLQ